MVNELVLKSEIEWISVVNKKRLPKVVKDERYLVCTVDGEIYMAKQEHKGYFSFYPCNCCSVEPWKIAYWAYLPENFIMKDKSNE